MAYKAAISASIWSSS